MINFICPQCGEKNQLLQKMEYATVSTRFMFNNNDEMEFDTSYAENPVIEGSIAGYFCSCCGFEIKDESGRIFYKDDLIKHLKKESKDVQANRTASDAPN